MAQLVTINVAQLVTIKMAKRGPVSNITAYIYIHTKNIYIYIYIFFVFSIYTHRDPKISQNLSGLLPLLLLPPNLSPNIYIHAHTKLQNVYCFFLFLFYPKGPKIEQKKSISLELFNLDLRKSPQNTGVVTLLAPQNPPNPKTIKDTKK